MIDLWLNNETLIAIIIGSIISTLIYWRIEYQGSVNNAIESRDKR